MAVRALSTLTEDTQEAFEDLQSFAARVGLPFEVRSTRRTCDEQRYLYQKGRTSPGPIVTNADGCKSWHVLGRAIDISIPGADRAAYAELGKRWEEMGGGWGGRFTGLDDPGHFEWHPGWKIEEACPIGVSCEQAVKDHEIASARGIPMVSMLAVGGLAAMATIWWERKFGF